MCSYTMQHIGMDDWAVTGNGAFCDTSQYGKAASSLFCGSAACGAHSSLHCFKREIQAQYLLRRYDVHH